MEKFKNKRILLLTTRFFDYEKAIVRRLETLGAIVDYYDERPSNSNWTKGIIRVAPKLLTWKTQSYYKRILEETQSKKYDFLLLIKGEATPEFFLEIFKKEHPETTSIFYAYDSVAEYPKFLKLNVFFDRNFTFEARDSEKYDVHFRPLFFIDDYTRVEKNQLKKYDITFIGSAHTDRYTVGENIEKESKKRGLNTFFYYYAPSKIIFYLKRIFDPHFKKFNIEKVKFQSLKHEKVAEIYKESFAILDINKPFQFGLSMRPFETLISGRKMITTNTEIINYPFYNPNNILVIDRDAVEIPEVFFETEFQDLPKEQIEKLTLDSWLDALFFDHQDEYWKWWK